jgi:DMSO/TMAO reductase YedYZ heme-binding membrane subunit
MGDWWKKVQKLSYVYFYGSALYVFLSYGDISQLIAIFLVTSATAVAFIKNREKLSQNNI